MEAGLYSFSAGDTIPGHDWIVVGPIGAGGMGEVYEVRGTLVDRRFVLKTLRRDLRNDEIARRRFISEIKVLASMRDEKIVNIFSTGVTNDDLRLPFFVMEKVYGSTLNLLLELATKLDLAYACEVFAKIASALAHVHERGIVHGDVKPTNIMLQQGEGGLESVKLLDFGIARKVSASVTGDLNAKMGTPRYFAPEQALGEPPSPTWDIYALAIILYEAVAQRSPWPNAVTDEQHVAAHILAPAEPLENVGDFPPRLCTLLKRALAHDAAERPQRMDDVESELRAIADDVRNANGNWLIADSTAKAPVAYAHAAHQEMPTRSDTPQVRTLESAVTPGVRDVPRSDVTPAASSSSPRVEIHSAARRAGGADASPILASPRRQSSRDFESIVKTAVPMLDAARAPDLCLDPAAHPTPRTEVWLEPFDSIHPTEPFGRDVPDGVLVDSHERAPRHASSMAWFKTPLAAALCFGVIVVSGLLASAVVLRAERLAQDRPRAALVAPAQPLLPVATVLRAPLSPPSATASASAEESPAQTAEPHAVRVQATHATRAPAPPSAAPTTTTTPTSRAVPSPVTRKRPGSGLDDIAMAGETAARPTKRAAPTPSGAPATSDVDAVWPNVDSVWSESAIDDRARE